MYLDINIQIENWVAYTAVGIFAFISLLNGVIFYSNKQKKAFKSRILYALLTNKMSNATFHPKKEYDLTFVHHKTTYYVKFVNGGKNKGIVATNPTTIYMQTFKDETSAPKSNELLIQVNKFLCEKLDGKKIIIFRGNLMKANKYINENEIEPIDYKNETFKTTILKEKEFNEYLLFIKEPPKK